MIHRPAALPELLAAAAGRIGGISILPIYPRTGEAAVRMILRGRKGSRAGVSILPGLVLHGGDGRFTPMAEALHRGETRLPPAG